MNEVNAGGMKGWEQMTAKIEIGTGFALASVGLVIIIRYPWKLLNSKTQNRQFSLY